ncbi:MAG TPA: class II aldolase/adducin family protein [Stellaceae bacterium]|jgi:ribulose-5-phosphate 4-epimerase/fuculose-1-phosphate aldolase|nr:class II aldolase/adducin family protein [Stellaceae bacterium]
MSDLERVMSELVVANRILAREGVVDAFGHISARHPERPDRYIMSRSRAPELVTADDLMVFELDGTPVDPRGRQPYAERPIHSGLYEARADVQAVIHNHSHAVIPFSVTRAQLRPMIHVAAPMGAAAPVWDIRDRFGDGEMLVVTLEQGRDLARTVGEGAVALMRGHGCVVASHTIKLAVMTAVYTQVNARLQMDALRLGEPKYLSRSEIETMTKRQQTPLASERAWEYWRQRAGASDL